MHFTIERLRTMVLAAGILLLVSLGVFLAVARFRHPINLKELPKRLGIDIQQEANGVTFSHALGAHSQFKIHASKVVQLKTNHMVLHDVRIELYGDDGRRVDRIEGAEFEYDQKHQTAKVRADGTLVCADATGSIHRIGAHVQGLDACNGWTFWQYEDKGKLYPIDFLRQRLRADLV